MVQPVVRRPIIRTGSQRKHVTSVIVYNYYHLELLTKNPRNHHHQSGTVFPALTGSASFPTPLPELAGN